MLLWMDSFDHLATADLAEKYAAVTGTVTIQATGGRRGGGALQGVPNAAFVSGRTISPAPHATAIMGMAYRINAVSAGTITALEVRAGGVTQVSLCMTSGGVLQVRRGSSTGTVIATGPIYAAAAFAYVELKVAIHASAGTVALRVNGAEVVNLPGLNTSSTGAAAWDSVVIGNTSTSGITQQFDDLYVCDGGGAAPWNDFLGDCRVDVRLPTGGGATTGWTPSAGANWTCVDETAPNDDTDYTEATAAGLTDTFVVADAPVANAIIYGVQHCLSARKTDAGTATIAPVIRHGGADQIGADLFPGTTYGYLVQIAAVNPGTGAAWTEAGFNAAEFGFKRTI